MLPLPYAVGLLLYKHYWVAEGGDRLPFFFATDHGLNQGPAREVAAADHPHEDTAMLFSSGAHLHRVLQRVLRAGHSVATPGRLFPTNPAQESPELPMSGENLRHAEDEDAVMSIQPRLKEGTYRRDYGVPKGVCSSMKYF
ncbi:hypothetical protein PYW08_007431 [Mythimna loreyi]|uniref:Uncharacterized protein n=1 Tax=Mythimna loreyi TaxID=667449 RepID=A0ACC2QBN2_9NEOP|nr:hypothetical protein PYW08_007431 [Mythimna loreyi]